MQTEQPSVLRPTDPCADPTAPRRPPESAGKLSMATPKSRRRHRRCLRSVATQPELPCPSRLPGKALTQPLVRPARKGAERSSSSSSTLSPPSPSKSAVIEQPRVGFPCSRLADPAPVRPVKASRGCVLHPGSARRPPRPPKSRLRPPSDHPARSSGPAARRRTSLDSIDHARSRATETSRDSAPGSLWARRERHRSSHHRRCRRPSQPTREARARRGKPPRTYWRGQRLAVVVDETGPSGCRKSAGAPPTVGLSTIAQARSASRC